MSREKVKVLVLKGENETEDRYALSETELGGGKFAKVYKAVNMENPNKKFAVKSIHIESQKVREEYLEELNIIKHLPQSPNVVQIHSEHLQSDNYLYIFEEYCQGGSLYDSSLARKGKPYTEAECFDMFFQASSGVIHLHNAGIIHEDIKPANIVIRGKRYKLCDFGVSHISKDYKLNNFRGGTVSYMPPEKLRSHFVPSEKSDIFSLGVCLYQVFFGFHPYISSRTSDYRKYLCQLQVAQLRPLSVLLEKYSSPSSRFLCMIAFLQKMLHLNVTNRVGLQELKSFLTQKEPFCKMIVPQQDQLPLEKVRPSFAQNFEVISESCIIVPTKTSTSLCHEFDMLTKKSKNNDFKIIKIYFEESRITIRAAQTLYRGMECLRRSNFGGIALNKMKAIQGLDTDLSMCSELRVMKMLNLYFLDTLMSNFRDKYIQIIEKEGKQQLVKEAQFWHNEFIKYLLDFPKSAQQSLIKELRNCSLEKNIARLIVDFYARLLTNTQIIKQNKDSLLSLLFLEVAPTILLTLDELEKCLSVEEQSQFLASSRATNLLSICTAFLDKEVANVSILMKVVEQGIAKTHNLLFEFDSDSDEFEIVDMGEKDIDPRLAI